MSCLAIIPGCGSDAHQKQNLEKKEYITESSNDIDAAEKKENNKKTDNKLKAKSNHEDDLITLKYSDKAQEDYIEKCIFLGDSRTVGFGMTSYPRKGSWLADIGITHIGAQSMKYKTKEGTTYTCDSYWETHQASVVYVCYGVNGINTIKEEQYIKEYDALIDKIKEKMPKSRIVIVSILPVRDDGSYRNVLVSEDIRHYNDYLYELAENKEVSYLNLYELIADEDGQMNEKYDSGDGLHFNTKTYDDIYDYIIHHPVTEYATEGLNEYPKESMIWHTPVKKKTTTEVSTNGAQSSEGTGDIYNEGEPTYNPEGDFINPDNTEYLYENVDNPEALPENAVESNGEDAQNSNSDNLSGDKENSDSEIITDDSQNSDENNSELNNVDKKTEDLNNSEENTNEENVSNNSI